jgi:hypothetical protein
MECWNNDILGFFPIFHFSVFPYDYVIWGEMNPAPLIRENLQESSLLGIGSPFLASVIKPIFVLTKVSIDTIIFMNRPSHKEINRKIKQAKEAVLENRISVLNPVSVAADTLELGIHLQDISYILIDLLEEITPNEYAGQYPPTRSYEHEIEGYELLAFRWLSKKLGCRIYLKLTIQGNRMWLVSLHEDRKKDERG